MNPAVIDLEDVSTEVEPALPPPCNVVEIVRLKGDVIGHRIEAEIALARLGDVLTRLRSGDLGDLLEEERPTGSARLAE